MSCVFSSVKNLTFLRFGKGRECGHTQRLSLETKLNFDRYFTAVLLLRATGKLALARNRKCGPGAVVFANRQALLISDSLN